jgi:hypothetical protein
MARHVAEIASVLLTTSIVVAGCGGTSGATPTSRPGVTAGSSAPPSIQAASPIATAPTAPTVVLSATPAEPALTVDWAKGGPAPSEPCTYSPSVDSAGRIWVAVCWESAFWILSSKGAFVEQWGTQGADPGAFDFSYPASHDSIGGIAFAPDGSFYTFDAGNDRVQHFDATRKLIGTWGSFGTGDGQFAKPTSIAVGHDGLVYVADASRSDVQTFDADGGYMKTIGKGSVGPGFAYLAVDASGNVFVNHGHSIGEFSSDGTLVRVIDTAAITADPAGMAVGPDGTLFVLARGESRPEATIELDPDGNLLHIWPGVGESLAIAPDGTAMYVADVGAAVLTRYALPKQ